MLVPSGDTSPRFFGNYVRDLWCFPTEVGVDGLDDPGIVPASDDDPRQCVFPVGGAVGGADQDGRAGISDQRCDLRGGGDTPVVPVSRAVVSQVNALPGDGGEARSLSRSHDERLPLTESSQLSGRDPGVDGLVRVPGTHDARRERSHCRARRGESAREGGDDDDASAPGLGQE